MLKAVKTLFPLQASCYASTGTQDFLSGISGLIGAVRFAYFRGCGTGVKACQDTMIGGSDIVNAILWISLQKLSG